MPYKATYNHQIPYTPRHSGSIRMNLDMPWISVGYTVRYPANAIATNIIHPNIAWRAIMNIVYHYTVLSNLKNAV